MPSHFLRLGPDLCLHCCYLTITRYTSQIPRPSKPSLGSLSSRKPSLTYRYSMPFLRFHRPDFSFPALTTPLWPVFTSVSPSLKSPWRLREGLNFSP